MTAMTNKPISFPGLFGDWEFNPDPVAIDIGNGIYWYGIILAAAMLCGLLLAMKQAKRFGLEEDHIMDLTLWGVPSCIIGSRIYYVLFYLDLYRDESGALDWSRMIAIWDGGLAMYGTVIAGVILAVIYAKRKKIPLGALTDAAVPGLILGQVIGRWANFINREAFGAETDLPWRMELWIEGYGPTGVHPTFFYESMWNLIGLLMIVFVITKGRRFDGENTCFYFIWYGIGRALVEGLRTDSLYLFDWTIMGEPIRVSQALSVVLVVIGLLLMIVNIRKADPERLYVYRVAEEKRAAALAAAAEEEVIVDEQDVAETVAAETVPEAETAEEPANGDQD